MENPGCTIDDTKTYEFENSNSKLVLDILDGKIEENTNVQQSIASQILTQRWTVKPSSEGGNYYSIHSAQDEGFALKVESEKNGGNIFIAQYSETDSNMLFKFSKNTDGSYMIMTKISKDACFIEVINASTEDGGNVQQWVVTNHSCQNWKLNEVSNVESQLSIVKTKIY